MVMQSLKIPPDRAPVADEAEQSREPWNAGVGIAGDDRSLSRLVWRRELLAIVHFRKLHVGLEGLDGPAVTGIGRLDLCQDAGNVTRAGDAVFEKPG